MVAKNLCEEGPDSGITRSRNEIMMAQAVRGKGRTVKDSWKEKWGYPGDIQGDIGGHAKHPCICPRHNEKCFKFFTQTTDLTSVHF